MNTYERLSEKRSEMSVKCSTKRKINKRVGEAKTFYFLLPPSLNTSIDCRRKGIYLMDMNNFVYGDVMNFFFIIKEKAFEAMK